MVDEALRGFQEGRQRPKEPVLHPNNKFTQFLCTWFILQFDPDHQNDNDRIEHTPIAGLDVSLDINIAFLYECVRCPGVLWNQSVKFYKNRNNKKEEWVEICSVIHADLDEKVDVIKTKYVSLRYVVGIEYYHFFHQPKEHCSKKKNIFFTVVNIYEK